MYEDLVRALRLNVEYRQADNVLANAARAADVIEELQKAVYFHKYNSAFWEDKYNSLADEKWISVTERLPDYGERVLVTNGVGFVCESFLSQNGKWQRGGVDMFFMTPAYWMPLPTPPEMKGPLVKDIIVLDRMDESEGEE